MTRPLLLVGLLFAGTAIDGAWLSRLPFGIAPDLAVLVLISAAVRGGLPTGALLGGAAGYLRDLASGTPLGVYTLVYLIVGCAAGSTMTILDFNQRLVPAMTAAVATVLVSLLAGGVITVTGLAPVNWLDLVWSAAIVASANALFARPVDALVCRAEHVARRQHPAKAIGYRVFR